MAMLRIIEAMLADEDLYERIRDCLVNGDQDGLIASTLTKLDRDGLTQVALEVSLCPLHMCDYAICFDDGNPECAPIRVIHPGHDT
jgi:hypothetical protein